MSDDAEKAFEPTPQRIERAKREGNVARSGELGANLAFAASALAVAGLAPFFGAAAARAIVLAAGGKAAWIFPAAALACALLPIACAAIAAVAATILQAGGLHFGALGFKLERLDPIEGCKRIASRETFAHAARAAVAFAVATAAMVPPFVEAASRLPAASSVAASAAVAWRAAGRVALAAAATGVVFAAAEYAAARNAWLRKLRMSFDERKREAKEQEGDPLARGRRRALHRSLSRGAIAKVKDASFVVVNPTHVAVALEYGPPQVPVPVVTVRAAGEVALRVRTVAEKHGVAIVENAPLARGLYRDGAIGEPIARAHYVAVATIVAALRRNGGAVR
jgi:flagellar biosynthesis protein FlhB